MMVLTIITGCLIINMDLIFCFVINDTGQNANNINLTSSIKTNDAKKLDLNEDEFNLLILHMNDMHSRILETTVNSAPFCREKICYGGFSRVKLVSEQFKERYKSQNWSVLFLNAGDNFQGSPFYNLFKWKVLAELIPDLGFDVMTLGNHEFDDGVELLSNYLSNLKAPPTIVCNVDTSNETSFKNISINRSKIFTMKGRQIAVVGYLTPDTMNMGDVGNITIKNEINCLKSEVSKLKASNVDIIIALGHSGYEMDKQIAAEVPSIDLVVGGHSHTFLWNGDKAPSIENISGNYPTWIERNSNGIDAEGKIKVPVVQSYAYTKYLGLLKMSFSITKQSQFKLKSAEGNPILLSSENYSEDPVMKEKIKKWKKEVDKKYSQIIGNTKVHLNGDGRICRNQECNLGNLIADSFIDYGKRHNVTDEGTYIAFVHSGSIRSNIDPPDGNIQYGDLLSALPYSNKLVQIKVKGEDLYQIFEHSVSAIQNNLGRFLQVSGLRVQYNQKSSAGNRVKSIVVHCKICNAGQLEPVLRENEYNVVTVDHILKGGDDFRPLNDSRIVKKYLNTTDFEAALEYLSFKSPILPEIQNRITFVN